MECIKAAIHNNANPLTRFDAHLFQTVIKKVVIHSPIEFSFCFQGGIQIKINAENIMMEEGIKAVNNNYKIW
ncbi:hypothetical protein [Clostridium minihomine]|uniref:hypothetical protein n=1 Tax=Clostridium minihomine TaxID=2045012 RepID=UPI000C76AC0E|nr:hypothetical protein [Clostridium minihomine]